MRDTIFEIRFTIHASRNCHLHLSRVLYKFTPFYAKQTQFAKKSNVYNRSFYNELQLKMNNGHLVKTNPIQTQFYPPPADLPAIFFQGFSCIFKSLSSAFLLQSPLFKHFATSGSFLLSSPSDTSPSSLHDG